MLKSFTTIIYMLLNKIACFFQNSVSSPYILILNLLLQLKQPLTSYYIVYVHFKDFFKLMLYHFLCDFKFLFPISFNFLNL